MLSWTETASMRRRWRRSRSCWRRLERRAFSAVWTTTRITEVRVESGSLESVFTKVIFVRVFVWSTSFWRDIRLFSFLHSFAPLTVEHVPFEAETMPAPPSLDCGVVVEERVCCAETAWRCCEEAK